MVIRSLYLKFGLPFLRKLSMHSTVFGPVKKRHVSVPTWLHLKRKEVFNVSGNEDQDKMTLQVASEKVEITKPIAAYPGIPQNFVRHHSFLPPELYVVSTKNSRLATHWYEIISSDDGIFEDLFYPHEDSGTISARCLIIPRLPRLQKREGTFATILTKGANNYYHWLIDCLSRLWLLEKSKLANYKLIVPKGLLPFQQSSLSLLGFTEDHLAPFGDEHWQMERLIVPSLTNKSCHSHPEACRWLANRLQLANNPATSTTQRKIYISRKHADKRRILNEEEIEQILAHYGFVTIYAEQLDFQTQILLFHNAEIVVGSHGAGLTNILFMQAGSLVVELVPYLRAKTCYFSLASAMRVNYICVTDAPEQAEDVVRAHQPDVDFYIPPKRLENALKTLDI